MQENNPQKLSLPIRRLFHSLTDNKQVIDLAVKIQQAIEQGHSCIEYNTILEDDLISSDGTSGYIVINNNRAGFRRLYRQEKFIRDEFIKKAQNVVNSDNLRTVLKEILSISAEDATVPIDKQWQASLAFLWHKRFILNGGPGTGKTTTVIRMLLIYQALYPNNKVALAAPTGKAANRLTHSINDNSSTLALSDEIREQLIKPAQTLHRLLAYNPQNNKLKYNQNNPLPYDLLIIDEASMLDISMAHALLKALKPTAQLVLIGDKDQLPAVDAGNVFADLCLLNKQKITRLNLLQQLQDNKEITPKDVESSSELDKNYRFIQGSIVAQLSEALHNNDYQQFKSYHAQGLFVWHHALNTSEKKHSLKQWYQNLEKDKTAILLSPTNFGENSVEELNQIAADILHPNKSKSEGIPIMVSKNDYSLNIFNGDIGNMTWHENKWQVAFVIDNALQYIQFDAISHKQMAHAISIHKSQGSEYDHVLIAIPDNLENELLTKQLLYTAITRVKSTITLWASEQVIKKIMATDANRTTFLKELKINENN